MFETMVAGWVAIISVSHIPCYSLFDTQSTASPLSLACALQFFYLIALLIFLHRDWGPLVYACIVWKPHEPWTYRCIFLSLFFPTTALRHSFISHQLCFSSLILYSIYLFCFIFSPPRVVILLSSLHGGQSHHFHYLSYGH